MSARLRDLRFLLALALAAAPLVGYRLGENWYTLAVSFLAIPLADALFGRSTRPDTPAERARLEATALPRLTLVLYVPLHLGLIVWGAGVVARDELAPLQALGLMLSVGVVTGAQGITFAHELGHGRTRAERWLAHLLLVFVCYGHFTIEHNRGHHVRVATPEDPASARFGEGFWRFLPRTVIGGYLHAWHLEAQRLAAHARPAWHWTNALWWLTAAPFAIAAALAAWAGPLAAVFFFVQSAMAVLLLEAVNYVEHYGLHRRRLADGRYERVAETHAWDSDARVTNLLLVNLQRHADHHTHPGRAYQALQPSAHSPKLPAGYAAMVPLALVPPLWFAVMNARVPDEARAAARASGAA